MTKQRERFGRLLEVRRSLGAAEAAVFDAYFESPARTVDTDLVWLARQCHKELVDGLLPRVAAVQDRLEGRSATLPFVASLTSVTRLLVEAVEEQRHLEAFLAAWSTIAGPEATPPTTEELRREWAWPENTALAELRRTHHERHGLLGARVTLMTEGGGATLYRAGLARRGRSANDDAIAEACERVLRDEEDHAQAGIAGLDDAGLDDADWDLLGSLLREQLVARVDMRNAQFGRPLAPAVAAALTDAG